MLHVLALPNIIGGSILVIILFQWLYLLEIWQLLSFFAVLIIIYVFVYTNHVERRTIKDPPACIIAFLGMGAMGSLMAAELRYISI